MKIAFFRKRRHKQRQEVEELPPNRRRPRAGQDSAEPPPELVVKAKSAGRVMSVALRVILAAAITVGTVWSFLLVYEHATTSYYFSADEFQISGEKRLAEAEILKTAGLAKGMNIFKVDMERAAWLLREHPWIADAEVVRRLPRRIEISIVERKAVAIVTLDVPYLVDDSGQVFKRWVRGDPVLSPVITGLGREDFIEDKHRVEEVLRDAIALAGRYRAAGLQRIAPLDEIHWKPDDSFSLAMGEDPFYVYFGRGPYRTKLTRLTALLAKLKRDGVRPEVIFFDNEIRPDRITVKQKSRAASEDAEDEGRSPDDSEKKRLSKI